MLALHHRVMEVWQPIFVHHPLGVDCVQLLAVGFHIVDREMLQCRGNFQITRVVTLQALDVAHRHAPSETRILAPRLVISAPIRVALNVDDRRPVNQPFEATQRVRVKMPAIVNRARFVRKNHSHRMHKIGVPRRRQADTRREKRRRPVPLHAVQSLVPLVGTRVEPFNGRTAMI